MENKGDLYIELLKKVLIDYQRAGLPEYRPLSSSPKVISDIAKLLDKSNRGKKIVLCEQTETSRDKRFNGLDWPRYADSMIGMKRLDNIEFCIRDVVKNNVPGDLIELGVWRGGASILMRAVLKALNVTDRKVWLADSFEGLPRPDAEKYPADKGDIHHTYTELAIPIELVKGNFEKYGLLDDQVKFLKGWFRDTLPTAPIEKLSVLRLDGDMYESTMDGLVNLYPKLSLGGYIIVDDWGAIPACKRAVEDYRKQYRITEEIKEIDWTGVYWKKEEAKG